MNSHVDIRTDTPELIREIQEYLRALAFFDARLPQVTVDGIYGSETTNAVLRFQQISGLPETGVVDPQTWDAIFLAYRALLGRRATPSTLSVFPAPAYVLHPGEENFTVLFLQVMLNAISERYDNVLAVALTNVYDEPTVQNVKNLQRIFGLEENGLLDRPTWDAITAAYNSLSEQNPLNEQ